MNKAAITKHEIYNKLIDFSEQDLSDIVKYIDFIRHKKKMGTKNIIKLEGILKDQDIDFSILKEFKQNTWKHVEQEFENG
ncbi:hypothetical protein [Desulfotignum phosphitoxidans]|jgi:hypothetical protein|uniref:Uncharacterized protein n=1 Tax=Desulfotignum phosphitoxidans DSM 13687 TaxID=1286635 RepID=S0G4C3_9BACT|nr:hypothetical protein [Desulfotignum phosphitoxidans]EMS78711.1 hypothetical protein Dpo_7c01870 [Desulfotignum phosphitoxidans DSM 13687]